VGLYCRPTATNYPKRPVFVSSDALRKIDRELEALSIEIMSITNIVNMDPKVRAILARKKAQEIHERSKQIVRQHEMDQHLRDHHERKKKTIARRSDADAIYKAIGCRKPR
jgi:hypothetical protein